MLDPTDVATFVYKTANPFVVEAADAGAGHDAYIRSFKMKTGMVGWRLKFEKLMTTYMGTKFTFEELEELYNSDYLEENPRYTELVVALYDSLKQ